MVPPGILRLRVPLACRISPGIPSEGGVEFQDATRPRTVGPDLVASYFVRQLRRIVRGSQRRTIVWEAAVLVAIFVGGILLRLRDASFLGTVEEPCQDWWRS